MHHSDRGERPCRRKADDEDCDFWAPDRGEIVTQYFTRYLFFSLSVVYFSTVETLPSGFLDIEQLLLALGAYFVLNSWLFHQALRGLTLPKIRSAMSADLAIVTVCVVHDPNLIPPSALVYLMVLLGNGMRYGMRVFAEVLGASFVCMAFAFALRYRFGGFVVTAGDVFYGIFWVTLALYAYILTGRLDGQRRELDRRSRFDALTGLLNRHGLLAAADRLLGGAGNAQPATVLFADLDQFKSVNDRYGHGAGDRVLAQFAQIFAECTEAGVCGRWGGDEFVAILPPRDAAAVAKIFEQIDARIDAWRRSNALPLAASLGVAQAPQDGHDLVTLLSVADIHLYQSKSRQPAAADVPAFFRTAINEPQVT